MKILVLTNNDMGLYKFRKELLQELLCPGTFLTDRVAEPELVFVSVPVGEFTSELQKIGCRIINTPLDRRSMNLLKDLKLFNYYRKLLMVLKPDVVFTYTIKPNIYGGILCRLLKIPYISNITGLGTAIENQGFISRILLELYKFALNGNPIVFFQNEKDQELFKRKRIVKRKTQLIPGSGVNLMEHSFEDYPPEQKKTKFLFIGRVMKEKGIEEYLSCAEYIHKKYPDTEFGIIGAYEDNSYEKLIKKLQMEEIVKYYGQQKDVHQYIKGHHATILPSYHEGLSNVLLESAATGRPVLASKIPGCLETFEDGMTGIGFLPRNTQALIDAVEIFLRIPYEKKKEMGKKAREKVEKEFDRKLVVQAYLGAIRKIDGGKR